MLCIDSLADTIYIRLEVLGSNIQMFFTSVTDKGAEVDYDVCSTRF